MLTIIAGVSIFVIGQFILKLILDPLVTFKTVLGELSAFFLREQAKITNGTASAEIQNELKKITASIIAHQQAIPFYTFFSFLLKMPSRKSIATACHSLNSISYNIAPDFRSPPGEGKYQIIRKEMEEVSENLKIKIDYKISK